MNISSDQWTLGRNLPKRKRWASADITYVRENHQRETALELASALGQPVKRVRRLLKRLKLKARRAITPKASKVPHDDSVQIVQDRARSAASAKDRGCILKTDQTRHSAFTPPADLKAFLAASTINKVAQALKVSRGTAYRLRDGYWPFDERSLLAAWDAYRGRLSPRQSGWFLRRVQAGGCIHHAGGVWSAPTLAGRDGQTLAVARVDASTLLAQTLELPPERFVLTAIQESPHA